MTDTHIWGGKERPAHVKNIKDWTQQVDDKLMSNMIVMVNVLYRRTYNVSRQLTEDEEDTIQFIARETMDKLYGIARENGIEVWHPTADSYDF